MWATLFVFCGLCLGIYVVKVIANILFNKRRILWRRILKKPV